MALCGAFSSLPVPGSSSTEDDDDYDDFTLHSKFRFRFVPGGRRGKTTPLHHDDDDDDDDDYDDDDDGGRILSRSTTSKDEPSLRRLMEKFRAGTPSKTRKNETKKRQAASKSKSPSNKTQKSPTHVRDNGGNGNNQTSSLFDRHPSESTASSDPIVGSELVIGGHNGSFPPGKSKNHRDDGDRRDRTGNGSAKYWHAALHQQKEEFRKSRSAEFHCDREEEDDVAEVAEDETMLHFSRTDSTTSLPPVQRSSSGDVSSHNIQLSNSHSRSLSQDQSQSIRSIRKRGIAEMGKFLPEFHPPKEFQRVNIQYRQVNEATPAKSANRPPQHPSRQQQQRQQQQQQQQQQQPQLQQTISRQQLQEQQNRHTTSKHTKTQPRQHQQKHHHYHPSSYFHNLHHQNHISYLKIDQHHNCHTPTTPLHSNHRHSNKQQQFFSCPTQPQKQSPNPTQTPKHRPRYIHSPTNPRHKHCPLCTHRLTYLYHDIQTHQFTDMNHHYQNDDNDNVNIDANHILSPRTRLKNAIPPYCSRCKAYLLFDSLEETEKLKLLNNLTKGLEDALGSGTEDDENVIENENETEDHGEKSYRGKRYGSIPRNAKILVVASQTTMPNNEEEEEEEGRGGRGVVLGSRDDDEAEEEVPVGMTTAGTCFASMDAVNASQSFQQNGHVTLVEDGSYLPTEYTNTFDNPATTTTTTTATMDEMQHDDEREEITDDDYASDTSSITNPPFPATTGRKPSRPYHRKEEIMLEASQRCYEQATAGNHCASANVPPSTWDTPIHTLTDDDTTRQDHDTITETATATIAAESMMTNHHNDVEMSTVPSRQFTHETHAMESREYHEGLIGTGGTITFPTIDGDGNDDTLNMTCSDGFGTTTTNNDTIGESVTVIDGHGADTSVFTIGMGTAPSTMQNLPCRPSTATTELEESLNNHAFDGPYEGLNVASPTKPVQNVRGIGVCESRECGETQSRGGGDGGRSIRLISTNSEERMILQQYSMKKDAATRSIAKRPKKKFELTSTICYRCEMPMMKKNNKMVCVVCPAIKKRARKIAKKKRALRSSPPLDPPCQQPQQPLGQQRQQQKRLQQFYGAIPRKSKEPVETEATYSLNDIGSIGACSESYQSQCQPHALGTEDRHAKEPSSDGFPDVLSYDGNPTLISDDSRDYFGYVSKSESNQRNVGVTPQLSINRSEVYPRDVNVYRRNDFPDVLLYNSSSYNSTDGSNHYMDFASMSDDACRLYALEEGLYGGYVRVNNTGHPSFTEPIVPRQSTDPNQQQQYLQANYDDAKNHNMASDNDHYWVQYSSSLDKSGPSTNFSFDNPMSRQLTSQQFRQNHHHPSYTDHHYGSTHVYHPCDDFRVERRESIQQDQQYHIDENARAPGENIAYPRCNVIDTSFNHTQHPIQQRYSYESQQSFHSYNGDIRFLTSHHPHEAELSNYNIPQQNGSMQKTPSYESRRADGERMRHIGHFGMGRSNSFDIHRQHSHESHQSLRSRAGSVVSDTQCPRNLPPREMIWQHHIKTNEGQHTTDHPVNSSENQDRRFESDIMIQCDEQLNFDRRPDGKSVAVCPKQHSGSQEKKIGSDSTANHDEQLDFDSRSNDRAQHEVRPRLQTSHPSRHTLIDEHEGEKSLPMYSELRSEGLRITRNIDHRAHRSKTYPSDIPPSNQRDPLYPDNHKLPNASNEEAQKGLVGGKSQAVDVKDDVKQHDSVEEVVDCMTDHQSSLQSFDRDEEKTLPRRSEGNSREKFIASQSNMDGDDGGRHDFQCHQALERDTSISHSPTIVNVSKPLVHDLERVKASLDMHERDSCRSGSTPTSFLDSCANLRRVDCDFTIEKIPADNKCAHGNNKGIDSSYGRKYPMPRVEIDDINIEVIKPNTPRSTKSQNNSTDDPLVCPQMDDRPEGTSLSDELNANFMNRQPSQNCHTSPMSIHKDGAVPSEFSSHQKRSSVMKDKVCVEAKFTPHHPMTKSESNFTSGRPQFKNHENIISDRQQQDSDDVIRCGTSLSNELNARSMHSRSNRNNKVLHDAKYELNGRDESSHDDIMLFQENHNLGVDFQYEGDRSCLLPKTPKHRNGSKINNFVPSPAQSTRSGNESRFDIHDRYNQVSEIENGSDPDTSFASPSLSQSPIRLMRNERNDFDLHNNRCRVSEIKTQYNRTPIFQESSRNQNEGILTGNRQHRPPLPTGRRAPSSHHSSNQNGSMITLSSTSSHASVSRVNSGSDVRSIDYTYENILPESVQRRSPLTYEGTARERSIERAPEYTKEGPQDKTPTNHRHEQDRRVSSHHDLDIPSLEGDVSFDQKMVDLKRKLSSLKLQMSPASFHGPVPSAHHIANRSDLSRDEVSSSKFSFEERDDRDEAENRHVQPFVAAQEEGHSSIRMQTDRSHDFFAPTSKYIVLKNGFDAYSFLSDSELAERNRPDPTPTNGRTHFSGHHVNERKNFEHVSKCSVDPPGKRVKSSTRRKDGKHDNFRHRKESSGYDCHNSKHTSSHRRRPDPLVESESKNSFDDRRNLYQSVPRSYDTPCETPTTNAKRPSISQKLSQGNMADKYTERQQQIQSPSKEQREPAPLKEHNVELSIPSWVDEEMDSPLQLAKSQDSMDELLQKIDEIENDFDTIVASLPSMTDDASFSVRPSKSEDSRSILIETKSSTTKSKSQVGLTKSFESEVTEDSVVADVIGRMRRVQEYIDTLDDDNDDIESNESYDSHGEMTDLIQRLANAAESLRAL